MPVVAAVLIEPEGEPKKILRVTLPLGMQLIHGTRVIIDQNQPMTAPYVICFTNGCMADYEADPDMIAKMKNGQGSVVQAINSTGAADQPGAAARPISLRPMTVRRPIRRSSKSSRRSCRKSCRSVPMKRARSSSNSRVARRSLPTRRHRRRNSRRALQSRDAAPPQSALRPRSCVAVTCLFECGQWTEAVRGRYPPLPSLTKISATCGCRTGSPLVSGNRFCSET